MLNSRLEGVVTLQTITPSMASQWLKKNDHNRHASLSLVAEYARAILDDRWRINGETIKISDKGRILDGQHRLMACVKANRSFQSYVASGIDDDTFDTVDIGKKRTAADIIGIDGCSNSHAVAAAVRWTMLFRSGGSTLANIKIQPDEVRLFLAAEPAFQMAVSSALRVRHILAPGLAGALNYQFIDKDRQAADLFFLDLTTGSNLVPGDPVLVLREKLMRDRMSKSKLPSHEIAAVCIRAWNNRRSGNTGVTLLKGTIVGPDGKRYFPEIA